MLVRPIEPRSARIIAIVTGAALFILCTGLTAHAAVEPIRTHALTRGHIDLFEVTYDDEADGLKLSVKDDTNLYDEGDQFRDPATVSVVVDAEPSTIDVSGLPPEYDFLKVDGDTIHYLPQVQDEKLPWPGWSSERLTGTLPAGTTLAGGQPVSLAFEVDGPGNVFIWQSGVFGEVINKYIDTVDPADDIIPIAAHAHVHTNWAFTKPGDYTLTVAPTATTGEGGTLDGDTATYHFHIGDASAIAAPENSIVPSIIGEPTVGAAVTAEPGTWTPEPDEYRYQWLVDGKPVTGATTSTYEPIAGDVDKELSVRVTAIKAGHQAATVTSAQVTVEEPAQVTPVASLSVSSSSSFGVAKPVTVTVPGATGNVTISGAGAAQTKALSHGKATFMIARTLRVGTYTIKASYAGDENFAAAVATKQTKVKRTGTVIRVLKLTATPTAKSSGKASISVRTNTGFPPTATAPVTLYQGSVIKKLSVRIRSGKASFTVPALAKGKWTLRAVFPATVNWTASSKSIVISVTR